MGILSNTMAYVTWRPNATLTKDLITSTPIFFKVLILILIQTQVQFSESTSNCPGTWTWRCNSSLESQRSRVQFPVQIKKYLMDFVCNEYTMMMSLYPLQLRLAEKAMHRLVWSIQWAERTLETVSSDAMSKQECLARQQKAGNVWRNQFRCFVAVIYWNNCNSVRRSGLGFDS